MSSALFAKVTWLNKNTQFISGPLNQFERAANELYEIQRAAMSFYHAGKIMLSYR